MIVYWDYDFCALSVHPFCGYPNLSYVDRHLHSSKLIMMLFALDINL